MFCLCIFCGAQFLLPVSLSTSTNITSEEWLTFSVLLEVDERVQRDSEHLGRRILRLQPPAMKFGGVRMQRNWRVRKIGCGQP